MRRTRPNVYTIPPGSEFPATVAAALLDGSLDLAPILGADPLAAADATIYVPTQRAARALAHAFSVAMRGPAILPRIVPLGLLGEIEDRLALETLGARLTSLPPAIDPFDRLLALTRLLQTWNTGVRTALVARDQDERAGPTAAAWRGEPLAVASSFADALALAGDLATLLDDLGRQGVGWDRVGAAMDASDLDPYWQLTIDFLAIVAERWPEHLALKERMDPAERETRLVAAEVERLERSPPDGPVIVAGSTGSRPATAALIACIARLGTGAVILPGLDLDLDAEGWASVGVAEAGGGDASRAGHPQTGLKALIGRMGVAREEVRPLGVVAAPLALRARAVSEALRPARTTERWLETRKEIDDAALTDAFSRVRLVEAKDEQEEALAIALLMREALVERGRTAALVTPDRQLATRVRAELARWDLTVEDSAGVDITLSQAGALGLLALEAVSADLHPQALLSLLAHAWLRCGWPRSAVEAAAATLEIAAFRGVSVRPGLAGVRHALASAPDRIADRHAPHLLRTITAGELAAADALLDALAHALSPLLEALAGDDAPVSALAEALAAATQALSVNQSGVTLTARHEGALFVERLDEIASAGEAALRIPTREAPAVLRGLLSGMVVPPTTHGHPRLKILGLLEARLLPVDRAILAGLNEGVWPPSGHTDAFLNRPMRLQLGLNPPEKRLGQTAHDLVMAMGAAEIVLTRAQRADGEPTVPSRFIQRLDAFLGAAQAKSLRERGAAALSWARQIDQPDASAPRFRRPKPTPPVALRPARLSITAVETLYRDPYAIYARNVLRLDPLDDVDPILGAGDRGVLVHEALAAFAAAGGPPRLDALVAAGRKAFAPHMDEPLVEAFWWPRFLRVAALVVADETGRRERILHSLIEQGGRWEMRLADGSMFALTGRVDRIDVLRDGSLSITDYKTGQTPGANEVLRGLAPQLTLTAAMARAGGFPDVPPRTEATELRYVRVGGSRAKPIMTIDPKQESLTAVVDRHERMLREALERYRQPDEGYLSRVAPKKTTYAGAYDHLARVKEWSASGGLSEEDDG